jgi:hypothetical protein
MLLALWKKLAANFCGVLKLAVLRRSFGLDGGIKKFYDLSCDLSFSCTELFLLPFRFSPIVLGI